MVDFVEISNVCARKAIIEGVKRIINSDKVCHSYSDLNFGVTFFGTQCMSSGCCCCCCVGTITLLDEDKILWSLCVDHQLFALTKLDVTVCIIVPCFRHLHSL